MTNRRPTGETEALRKRGRERALEAIRSALEGLQYGSITILVQDGIVIQIDTTSKTRIDYSALGNATEGEGI